MMMTCSWQLRVVAGRWALPCIWHCSRSTRRCSVCYRGRDVHSQTQLHGWIMPKEKTQARVMSIACGRQVLVPAQGNVIQVCCLFQNPANHPRSFTQTPSPTRRHTHSQSPQRLCCLQPDTSLVLLVAWQAADPSTAGEDASTPNPSHRAIPTQFCSPSRVAGLSS